MDSVGACLQKQDYTQEGGLCLSGDVALSGESEATQGLESQGKTPELNSNEIVEANCGLTVKHQTRIFN